MQLDDSRGCPGYILPIHARAAGICLTCARIDRGGPQMQPPAVRLPDGVMFCDARQNDGHALTVAADARDDQTLRVGGVATYTPANQGCPR